MKTTIYHNPSCSKSRATLALILEHSIAPEIVLYLENPPDAATLKSLLTKLGMEPRELLRTDEHEYAALGLENPDITNETLVAALAAHPKLLQRPIVVVGDRAMLGRPPEAIRALFEEH